MALDSNILNSKAPLPLSLLFYDPPSLSVALPNSSSSIVYNNYNIKIKDYPTGCVA